MGEIGILNVGAGDNKLIFDPADWEGMKRAAEMVEDMIRRGYILMVETGDKDADGKAVYQRVQKFDPQKCEYIIGTREHVEESEEVDAGAEPQTESPKTRGRKPLGTRRIPAQGTRGIAVARTAGG